MIDRNLFSPYGEGEDEKDNFLNPFIRIDALISKDTNKENINQFTVKEMVKIFEDKNESDNEEMKENTNIKENEQNLNFNVLDELKNLGNRDTASKTKNNLELKIIEPEKKFTNRKRKKLFFIDNSNKINNKNQKIKKKDITSKSKEKKPTKKNAQKNNSSLQSEIKSFNTSFNKYIKYLFDKNFNFNESDKKPGPNGLYLNSNFTQKNLAVEYHSPKLKRKIAEFILEKKLKKLKETKDEKILEILESPVKDLIEKFYKFIFENLAYFKENVKIKKINAKFLRIRKYPLIDFVTDINDKNYKIGYFRYFLIK